MYQYYVVNPHATAYCFNGHARMFECLYVCILGKSYQIFKNILNLWKHANQNINVSESELLEKSISSRESAMNANQLVANNT